MNSLQRWHHHHWQHNSIVSTQPACRSVSMIGSQLCYCCCCYWCWCHRREHMKREQQQQTLKKRLAIYKFEKMQSNQPVWIFIINYAQLDYCHHHHQRGWYWHRQRNGFFDFLVPLPLLNWFLCVIGVGTGYELKRLECFLWPDNMLVYRKHLHVVQTGWNSSKKVGLVLGLTRVKLVIV